MVFLRCCFTALLLISHLTPEGKIVNNDALLRSSCKLADNRFKIIPQVSQNVSLVSTRFISRQNEVSLLRNQKYKILNLTSRTFLHSWSPIKVFQNNTACKGSLFTSEEDVVTENQRSKSFTVPDYMLQVKSTASERVRFLLDKFSSEWYGSIKNMSFVNIIKTFDMNLILNPRL